MQRVAAIVLTYNEAEHVGECLASLEWCNEIWVVDSISTDGTVDICRSYTSNILQHAFEGFSAQRQWALDNIPFESEWILFADADERIPKALADEITHAIQVAEHDAYFVPRRQYFWGELIRYGDFARDYVLRLHRRGKGSYPLKEVHESIEIDGMSGRLREPMEHVARDDMSDLIDKINRYSTLEALRMYRTGQELHSTASQSYSRVNMVLKGIFKYLPMKPLFKFCYEFIVCQGFRDGRLGFTLALSQALYVYLSYFKLWELRNGLIDVQQASDKPLERTAT